MSNQSDSLLKELAQTVASRSEITQEMYQKHNIKRGLRNEDGTGVLVGITRIAEVSGYKIENGRKIADDGKLYYRGIDIREIVEGIERDGRFGFEEVVYLLLFDQLPTSEKLDDFKEILRDFQSFPGTYIEDVIIKIPARNIMNKMQRAVLTLYSYDEQADDISVENVLRQSLELISKAPIIMAYSYHSKRHAFDNDSLLLHRVQPEYSFAENILHLVRPNSKFTSEEAHLLDLLLIAQAEHGGGNNSTFATHVVSSTGTDTYSAIATAIGALKGPKHGGANLKVADMVNDIRQNVPDFDQENSLRNYLKRMMNREVYDKKGLIYGVGHAVYTKTDARVQIIREKCEQLALKANRQKEFKLICDIERLGGEMLQERNNLDYRPSANIDLYSSFIMEMLGIPEELFTPLFAVSRIAGWSAHRLEQILDTKIMRPGYVTLGDRKSYVSIKKRI